MLQKQYKPPKQKQKRSRPHIPQKQMLPNRIQPLTSSYLSIFELSFTLLPKQSIKPRASASKNIFCRHSAQTKKALPICTDSTFLRQAKRFTKLCSWSYSGSQRLAAAAAQQRLRLGSNSYAAARSLGTQRSGDSYRLVNDTEAALEHPSCHHHPHPSYGN